MFFSLIETANANRHEPYAYLHHIFKKLPMATTGEDYEAGITYKYNQVSKRMETDRKLKARVNRIRERILNN